jgi:hypothetical protein
MFVLDRSAEANALDAVLTVGEELIDGEMIDVGLPSACKGKIGNRSNKHAGADGQLDAHRVH